ncbi:MAG TPA: HD domain-containing protein [Bryobacteraceae bacterium]|nr:HD domain-containing protein [Bryobacteraceae bacterium]
MGIEDIRRYVAGECRRGTNVFGPEFFDEHLAVVASYADCLAPRLGANAEVVQLAAYLHDISAVRDITTLRDHAVVSAAHARELLALRGYPLSIAENVSRAIASHVTPVPLGAGTPEEICLSNADAISQIVRPAYWLFFAFVVRKCGFEEGREWLLNRMDSNWNALIEPARELVVDRYPLARRLVGDNA